MESQHHDPRQALMGTAFILLGAIGFSAKSVLIKLAYAQSAQIDAITLMALRMLISLPFFLAVAFSIYLTGSGHLIPRFGSRRFTACSMSVACVVTVLHYLAIKPVERLAPSVEIANLALALALISTLRRPFS